MQPQRLSEMEALALEGNVVKWVLAKAKVLDKPVAFDELMGSKLVNWEKTASEAKDLGLIPMVIEQSGRGERAYDIYSRPSRSAWYSWSGR